MRPTKSHLTGCTATMLSLALVAPASIHAQGGTDMETQAIQITRREVRPAQDAPAENFTGRVRVTPLFSAMGTSSVSAGSVSFEPGARSAWHTHPRGQVLIVTAGIGRVQRWGSPAEEIRPGDVVWIPPRVKHWHGAGPSTAMTHIALQEAQNGRAVDWLEKVSDAQYTSPPGGGATIMPNDSTARRGPYADIAPALDEITQQVLFGEVWERPGLSKRDRSLITVATLVALYRTNELPYHLKFALQNGVTKDELSELLTQLAFYAGWPAANSAVGIARQVYADTTK